MSHLNINGVDKPLDHVYVKARTENLFDASTLANDLHLSPSTGFPSSYSGRIATTTTIDVSAYTELTLTFSIQIASGTLAFMYSKFYNGSLVERVAGLESGSTIDVSDADSLYIAFYVGGHNITTDNVNWVMLNAGSTALPYQPYLITKEAWEARDKNDHLLWGRADTFTGTSSISVRGYGLPVKSWEIDGNSQQSGTPAPDNIIMPEFVGERTGNLFDLNATDTTNGYVNGAYLTSDGLESANSPYRISEYIEIQGSTEYTLVYGNSLNNPSLCFYDSSKQYISGQKYGSNRTVTVTSPSNAKYIRISYFETAISDVMLNSGSTDLPYEPYGWKLSFTSAGQTTPVYLGQVATTRRVRKLVLTGQENWNAYADIADCYRLDLRTNPGIIGNGLCTHFAIVENTSLLTDGTFVSGQNYAYFKDTSAQNLDGWKAYLAAQYAAGTPVVVRYVLAEPTTGIVNEPLMKIGDYADSITSTQAGVTIPTAKGNATLTTSNTVQPSTMHATYDKYISGGDVPVYLGQVPTTRWIKKIVFTGQEDGWRRTGSGCMGIIPDDLAMRNVLPICTHFAGSLAVSYTNLNDGECTVSTTTNEVGFNDHDHTTVDSWKQWLSDQYDAGTPVMVWYVLRSQPQTGIVNEPLAKIGAYTDTLTSEQAGIIIPTTDGNNTISVDTTLSPSRFEVKVHAKAITP